MHFSGYLAAGRRFFYIFLYVFYFLAHTQARFCEREPEAQGHQLLPTILDKISPISRSQHINSTHYFRLREGSRLRTKTIVQPDAKICIFLDIWRPGNVFSHFFVLFCISSPIRWPDSVKESQRHKDASSSPQLLINHSPRTRTPV